MTADPSAWALIVVGLPGVIALLARVLDGVWASRRDAEARRRSTFADAYAAVVAYAEFPYVVRRRRASAPEDERIRISTELRSVQERIAHHCAWLYTES